MYTNHGFATLGQIIEDVTGQPLDRYLRDRIFDPLVCSAPTSSDPNGSGPTWQPGMCCAPAASRRSPTARCRHPAGAGCTRRQRHRALRRRDSGRRRQRARLCAAARDAGHDVRAPLPARSAGTGNGSGVLSRPGRRTPDRRSRRDLEGLPHRHGARSRRGVGVLAFANTGWFDPAAHRCPSQTRSSVTSSASPMTPCAPTSRNIRRSGVTSAAGTPSVPACSPTPSPGCSGPASRSSSAAATSRSAGKSRSLRCAGAFASTPTATTLTPSASICPALGSGTTPVVFSHKPGGEVTALHLGFLPMSFQKRPDVRNPRPWAIGALVAGATAIAGVAGAAPSVPRLRPSPGRA